MADFITIPKYIHSSAGFVTLASEIAVETSEENNGVKRMDKSLAQRLEELDNEQEIQNINSQLAGLQKDISKLSQLEDLTETIDTVNKAKSDAQAAAINASNKAITADNAANAALLQYNSINTRLGNLEADEAEWQSKLENLSTIATQLNTVFDAQAEIQVISEERFNALSVKDDNTIYFVYDELDPQYTILGISHDPEYGSVTVSKSHGTRNEQVVLTANAATDCEFVKWLVYANDELSTHDAGTSNPLDVTIVGDRVYVAQFYKYDVYPFTFWSSDGSTMQAYGKAKTLNGKANNRTEIVVLSNSIESFEGNKYWIASNAQIDGSLYTLYDEDNETESNINVRLVNEHAFSFYLSDGETKYSNGSFYTTGIVDNDKTEIVITDNTPIETENESYIGQILYIDTSSIIDSKGVKTLYQKENDSYVALNMKIVIDN